MQATTLRPTSGHWRAPSTSWPQVATRRVACWREALNPQISIALRVLTAYFQCVCTYVQKTCSRGVLLVYDHKPKPHNPKLSNSSSGVASSVLAAVIFAPLKTQWGSRRVLKMGFAVRGGRADRGQASESIEGRSLHRKVSHQQGVYDKP